MKNALPSTNPVESTVSGCTDNVKPMFKYTVYNGVEKEADLVTNSWSAVVEYLLEDAKIIKQGTDWYSREREGLFNFDDCREFIEENIEDLAHWNGYKIEVSK